MTGKGKPFRYLWEQAVREAKLGAGLTGVAYTIATYANADGSSIHPGESRVAHGLGVSRSTVTRALGRLRDEGWLTKVRNGNSRAGQADEYRLSLPSDHAALATHGASATAKDRASSQPVHESTQADHASLAQGSCFTGDAPPTHLHQPIYTSPFTPVQTVATARKRVGGWTRAAQEAADRTGDFVPSPVEPPPWPLTRPSAVEPATP